MIQNGRNGDFGKCVICMKAQKYGATPSKVDRIMRDLDNNNFLNINFRDADYSTREAIKKKFASYQDLTNKFYQRRAIFNCARCMKNTNEYYSKIANRQLNPLPDVGFYRSLPFEMKQEMPKKKWRNLDPNDRKKYIHKNYSKIVNQRNADKLIKARTLKSFAKYGDNIDKAIRRGDLQPLLSVSVLDTYNAKLKDEMKKLNKEKQTIEEEIAKLNSNLEYIRNEGIQRNNNIERNIRNNISNIQSPIYNPVNDIMFNPFVQSPVRSRPRRGSKDSVKSIIDAISDNI